MQQRIDIWFNLLKACHDGINFYPSGNPIVTQQLENFISSTHNMLESDFIVFRLDAAGHWYLGASRLDIREQNLASVRWLSSILLERHIHTICFHRGLSIRDLERLINIFQTAPNKFPSEHTAPAILEAAKVWRIQLNSAPSSNESSEGPFSGFQADATYTDLGVAGLDPRIPQTEPLEILHDPDAFAPPREGRPLKQASRFETPLLIPAEEQDTLFKAMDEALSQGNLKRVADTLTLIRADLVAPIREERELAFSSYHVVIGAMINRSEEQGLYVVLKSMGSDLLACEEDDLFAIHLSTIVAIIQFFRGIDHMKGIIYGLNLLANQNLRLEGPRQEMVSGHVGRMMDLDLTTRVVCNTDPKLASARKALFHRHGMGVLKPLLEALYESEDRNIRKQLLEVLTNMGTLSYPHLLQELKQAMASHRPWYIKRNLLTLLSISPPPDLAPLLGELYKEENPKMRDLVVRCLFQIPTPIAYRMGKQLLRESSGSRLMKILRYVLVSHQSTYALEVMDVFKRVDDDRIRTEAVAVLGRIDSEESINYLGHILDKVQVEGKLRSIHRVAAAQALGRSKRERSAQILTRHKRDFNRDVRDAVQKALGST